MEEEEEKGEKAASSYDDCIIYSLMSGEKEEKKKKKEEEEEEKEKGEKAAPDQAYLTRWMELDIHSLISKESVPIKPFQVDLYPGQFKSLRLAYFNDTTLDLSLELVSSVSSVASPVQPTLLVPSQTKATIRVNLQAPKVNCLITAYIPLIDTV